MPKATAPLKPAQWNPVPLLRDVRAEIDPKNIPKWIKRFDWDKRTDAERNGILVWYFGEHAWLESTAAILKFKPNVNTGLKMARGWMVDLQVAVNKDPNEHIKYEHVLRYHSFNYVTPATVPAVPTMKPVVVSTPTPAPAPRPKVKPRPVPKPSTTSLFGD